MDSPFKCLLYIFVSRSPFFLTNCYAIVLFLAYDFLVRSMDQPQLSPLYPVVASVAESASASQG
jgi:hypothetical protein